jgi:ankyrin repeat protein
VPIQIHLTLLDHEYSYNNIEIIKILLENGADVNNYMDNEAPIFYEICNNNNIELAKIFLQYCPYIDSDILYEICEKNNIEILELLLNSKINSKSQF